MIVTIDGPAGAGKSSSARALAARLGFRFLDTGAMYRAVALAALEEGIDLANSAEIERLLEILKIEWRDDRIWLNGRDVTAEIRRPAVTAVVHFAADHAGVREHLVRLQRAAAATGDIVTEGRDQGTVAFPQADIKFFLTASSRERAQRRTQELQACGQSVDFDQLWKTQQERDARDRARPIGRLAAASDAIEVNTDGRSLEDVVDELERLVRAQWNPQRMMDSGMEEK